MRGTVTEKTLLLKCHHCGAQPLAIHPAFGDLHRVASDATPFRPGGTLALCETCGAVQCPPTEQWHAECHEIYNRYNIYHQSGGAEQPVFHPDSGALGRSQRLVKELRERLALPSRGALLDVGCANGGFLRAWEATGDWRLSGCEFDRRHEPVLKQIPGFSRLYDASLDKIEERFEIVSFIHVLEHICEPHQILRLAAAKLVPGGIILVQVPDCAANPAAITVADHSSHFGPNSLSNAANRAGLEIVLVGNILQKEITMVARQGLPAALTDAISEGRRILAHVDWLSGAVGHFRSRISGTGGSWGIFGTAIAGTWLAQEIPEVAGFFVDEDPLRQGKVHMGKPILSPEAVPPGSNVILALPEPQASQVRKRLQGRGATYHLLPPR